jgi:hypothetical protein
MFERALGYKFCSSSFGLSDPLYALLIDWFGYYKQRSGDYSHGHSQISRLTRIWRHLLELKLGLSDLCRVLQVMISPPSLRITLSLYWKMGLEVKFQKAGYLSFALLLTFGLRPKAASQALAAARASEIDFGRAPNPTFSPWHKTSPSQVRKGLLTTVADFARTPFMLSLPTWFSQAREDAQKAYRRPSLYNTPV